MLVTVIFLLYFNLLASKSILVALVFLPKYWAVMWMSFKLIMHFLLLIVTVLVSLAHKEIARQPIQVRSEVAHSSTYLKVYSVFYGLHFPVKLP